MEMMSSYSDILRVDKITLTAFATSALAVFSLSGLIAGRVGTLRCNVPSTGATVDCCREKLLDFSK